MITSQTHNDIRFKDWEGDEIWFNIYYEPNGADVAVTMPHDDDEGHRQCRAVFLSNEERIVLARALLRSSHL